MEITEVRIFPVNEDKLKAYCTITIDESFVVRDLKIIEGNSRLFVAMPSRKMRDGSFRDIVHPANAEMRDTLEKKIFEEYEKSKTEETSTTTENTPTSRTEESY